MLLGAGALKEKVDGQLHTTPLWVASANGHPDVVRLLLTARANHKATAVDGSTPFDVAWLKGNAEIKHLLSQVNIAAEQTDAEAKSGVVVPGYP